MDDGHPRAEIAVTTGPRVIAPGMAVLRPLPRMRAEPAEQGRRRVPVGSVPGEVDPPRF